MSGQATSPPMVLRAAELPRFDRGAGVVTLPYVAGGTPRATG
jgi:hypothetical protein